MSTAAVPWKMGDAGSGIARLLISAINVGEVYYLVRKYHGETLAESWRQSSGTLPITIEVPTADDIWDAALLKGRGKAATDEHGWHGFFMHNIQK